MTLEEFNIVCSGEGSEGMFGEKGGGGEGGGSGGKGGMFGEKTGVAICINSFYPIYSFPQSSNIYSSLQYHINFQHSIIQV